MSLQPLDLTTALRPSLLPDETLLFVQDAVGLYEGKFKIPAFQNGHAYLTSHRACYVDDLEPRIRSVAIDLKGVERYEFYAGFLKSSAKITFYPKPTKRSTFASRSQAATPSPLQIANPSSRSSTASPNPGASNPFLSSSSASNTARSSTATWICPICSLSNPIPSNFDPAVANPHTPLAPCLACGIRPSLALVLKAAIANASGRQAASLPSQLFSNSVDESSRDLSTTLDELSPANEAKLRCPRCTFQNHPSLLQCELCGASLVTVEDLDHQLTNHGASRAESPGPSLDDTVSSFETNVESIKFSFRGGGDKVFYERLKGAMTQRKWLLQNAPPIPRPSLNPPAEPNRSALTLPTSRPKVVGIAGLERQGQEYRKNNEVVIGSAFEDLEALMASAKEIVALAESFANKSAERGSYVDTLVTESATALGMVTTKEMLGTSMGSEFLYLSELSRNLAEFLTDDAKGVLRKEGGIMSLVDLWAVFNRARGGVELISPADFEKAARLWEKLGLPVRLRQFKNGLLVVQKHGWTDDKTIAQLLQWLQELHDSKSNGSSTWDWQAFGHGITAQEAAVRFGWSIGVASEELEMAEEKGALCREEGVEGVRFWENWIVSGDD